MANYTHEYSNYPEKLIELTNYMDADSSVAKDIERIKAYQASGNYDMAAQYLIQNPELKKYIFGSTDINRITEELRNTQIKAIGGSQQLFYQSSIPVEVTIGDVWLSDTEI